MPAIKQPGRQNKTGRTRVKGPPRFESHGGQAACFSLHAALRFIFGGGAPERRFPAESLFSLYGETGEARSPGVKAPALAPLLSSEPQLS